MILDNWYIYVALIASIASIVVYAYKFYNLPSEKQLRKVKEWLLYAVTLAEKELGSGTGRLKLRMVYDMFLTKFDWLARIITFERFTLLVDEALDEMKKLLEENNKIAEYVGKDDLNEFTE